MFQNDRRLKISTGPSRTAKIWTEQDLYWSEFVEKLSTPTRTTERLEEYKALKKSQQDAIKDIGGFVGGTLEHGRRKNENAKSRDLITLDADTIEPGGTKTILKAVASLGCAYAIYSTRKHEESAPRLRIILPLDRCCSPDEYEPIARKVAEFIGMKIFDPTTFETVRLMYWPSCSADSEYAFTYEDKPFLSVDGMLNLYKDWKDVEEWPEVPGATKIRDRSAKKQGDPIEKKGVVGAFCRRYSITEAIAEFLSEEYTECEGTDRYTFTGGSTVGGAVIYDDRFLYSHHATDPCSNRLCNAFDLVRIHLFGEKDEEASPDTPITNLPSFRAMLQYAAAIPEISQAMLKERYDQAGIAFSETATPDVVDDFAWFGKLKVNPETNKPLSTIMNVQLILEHDLKLRDRMYLDDFANRVMIVSPLPWEAFEYPYRARCWSDNDDAGLRSYIETTYGITGRERVLDGFSIIMSNHRKNRLKDYLKSLEWDGVHRVDSLLIDYFGAEDNIYSREAIRKCLLAAAVRVFYPGTKFDNMLILSGKQGIGKSTFFNKLGMDWYSDSLSTFEGRDAAELLQGFWIIEAGELTGLNRTEMNDVKQFLSKREDIYRAPYGRRTDSYPRKCIIVGTTNDKEFLKDTTGNRRFWPIDCDVTVPSKSIFTDLGSEVPQIWAEVMELMKVGENLLLSKEAEKISEECQGSHRERNPKEGMVLEFLNIPITEDWYEKDANVRRNLMISGITELATKERKKICTAEIYTECFHKLGVGDMQRRDSMEINNLLRGMDILEPMKNPVSFGPGYGKQRGFWINDLWKEETDSVETK